MSRQSRRAQQLTAIFMVSVLAGWALVPLRAGSGNPGQGAMPASGQRPGGAYADVHKWYFGFRVTIETNGLREVRSKELSKHGIPVDTYKYSIKREYVATLPLTGPIPGFEFPDGKFESGMTAVKQEEFRQNPKLALQNLMNFVGWTLGPASGKPIPFQMGVDIEDVLEHDFAGDDECSTEFEDVDHKETYSYHGAVLSDVAAGQLGFDLKKNAYAFQVQTHPMQFNASASRFVKKHIEDNIVRGGGDANGPQQEHHASDASVSLNELGDFQTPTLLSRGLLKDVQQLPSGVANQIKVSRKESPTKITSFDLRIIDDMMKNGTVTVTINYVIQLSDPGPKWAAEPPPPPPRPH